MHIYACGGESPLNSRQDAIFERGCRIHIQGVKETKKHPGVIKNRLEPISMPWLSMAFDCLRPRVRQRGAILPPGIADISAIRGLESQKAPQAVVQAGTLDHGRDEALHVPNYIEAEACSRVQGNITSDDHRQGRQRALGHDTAILAQRGQDSAADLPVLPVGNQDFEQHLVERPLKLHCCLDDCWGCWCRVFRAEKKVRIGFGLVLCGTYFEIPGCR
jgi:hypothetical protein